MDYDEISARYVHVRRSRLERLARKTRLTPREVAQFEELEDKMNSGDTGADWLRSFHLSNDDYLRLLEKVLKAAVALGEPHAREKYQTFIEEKGSMSPAVFLTPWDLTLAYLDREVGEFEDVERFYG